MKFICTRCGTVLSMDSTAQYCPSCGYGGMVKYHNNTKSSTTANRLIAELESMKPEVESAYKAFLEKVAPYDQKMYTMWQYKQRGIIAEEDMPKLDLMSRGEALRKYRTCLKEGKEWTL